MLKTPPQKKSSGGLTTGCVAEGWELRMHEALQAAHSRHFKWGQFDCALFSASILQAITGFDYGDGIRGQYSNKRGCYEFIASLGGLDEYLGGLFNETTVALARRGDLVRLDNALGICDGRYSLFLTIDKGLTTRPTLQCNKAWEIVR